MDLDATTPPDLPHPVSEVLRERAQSASVPGRIAMWWSASRDERVGRGSMQTSVAPRARARLSIGSRCGPVVASITMAGQPTKENPLPFKQIAIEVYQPLGGGLNIGGRWEGDARGCRHNPPSRTCHPRDLDLSQWRCACPRR